MADPRYPTGATFGYGNDVTPNVQPAPKPKPRLLFDACPLCAKRGFAVLRTGDCSRHPLYRPVVAPVMTWMRCTACGHVFTDGYFSPEVAAEIFERTNAGQQPGAAFEQNRMVSARIVERVARHVASGAWLDVGFGNGSLLVTAHEWRFEPVGLDLRASSVEAMQRLGVEAGSPDLPPPDEPRPLSGISPPRGLGHI